MFCLRVAAILCCALALVGEASARDRVAVLELSNPAGLTAQEAGYLTDLVRDAARESLDRDTVLIMTRENVLELLGDRDLSDCIGDCAVETGRNLGATYVVAGEVIRFGSSLRVSMSLHETESGNLVESEQASGATVEELESSVRELGQALFLPLRSQLGYDEAATKTGHSDDDRIVLVSGGSSPDPAMPASLSEGRRLMDALRARTGGTAYDQIKRFREVGELQARYDGRDLDFHVESTVIPPEHIHRFERSATGSFTSVLAGTEAWTTSAAGRKTVTGSEFARLQARARGNWLVVLRDLDSFRCQALAPRRIDGVLCNPVRVTADDRGQIFYLDAETDLIRMVELGAIHPVTNEPAACIILVEMYREVGRFLIPAVKRISYDNLEFGVYTLTSFTVNPEVDRAMFRK